MKTKCYCVGCKKHPLHERRNEFAKWGGWVTDYPKIIYEEHEEKQGSVVNCFDPESEFFKIVKLDKDNFKFPACAYGCNRTSTTLSMQTGFTIYAHCGNEDHEE